MIELVAKQDELHTLAACLLREQTPDRFILSLLQERGIEAYYAEIILSDVKTDIEDKRILRKLIAGGGFIFFAGLVLTTITYFMIAPSGIYYIFPMMMLIGVAAVGRRLSMLNN